MMIKLNGMLVAYGRKITKILQRSSGVGNIPMYTYQIMQVGGVESCITAIRR